MLWFFERSHHPCLPREFAWRLVERVRVGWLLKYLLSDTFSRHIFVLFVIFCGLCKCSRGIVRFEGDLDVDSWKESSGYGSIAWVSDRLFLVPIFLFCFNVCHSSEGFRKRFLILFLDESISPKLLSESKSQLVHNYFRVVKLPIVFGKSLACLVPCRPSARKCCCRLPRIIVVLLLGYQQIGKCKQPKSRLPFVYLRSFGFTTICLSSANREENDELKSSEVFFYNSNVGNVICQELMSSPFLDESASVSNPNR